MVRTQIQLPEEQVVLLKKMAAVQHKSMAEIIRQAREPFVHYEHEEIGYNYRMSNILAAIGRGQLLVLDERVKRKREIFRYYFQALETENIESRPVWKPMHLQPVFELTTERHGNTKKGNRKYQARCVGGKVAEDLFERGLCLPSTLSRTREGINYEYRAFAA